MPIVKRYPNVTLAKSPSYWTGDHLAVDESAASPDSEWIALDADFSFTGASSFAVGVTFTNPAYQGGTTKRYTGVNAAGELAYVSCTYVSGSNEVFAAAAGVQPGGNEFDIDFSIISNSATDSGVVDLTLTDGVTNYTMRLTISWSLP